MFCRLRFAPSPTGKLHLGGLRTSLLNYLFAKGHNGALVLRIEDTDALRTVPGASDDIEKTLGTSGITFDESPSLGGQFGPYFQSKRAHLYKSHAESLLQQGKAYRCFCSHERLEAMRRDFKRAHDRVLPYDRSCRFLNEYEIRTKLDEGIPYTIRMKVPTALKLDVSDMFRRTVQFDMRMFDDQVLLKSDGTPTYHLANVVDDHLMKITHVIRGEEWLVSTPKHLLLYSAFGWAPPKYGHISLLINPDGSKISKRKGDFSVDYFVKEQGFFPEALLQYLYETLFGLHTTGDSVMFLQDLVQRSTESLDQLDIKPVVLRLDRLRQINQLYLKHYLTDRTKAATLLNTLRGHLPEPVDKDNQYLIRALGLATDHVFTVMDVYPYHSYLFSRPNNECMEFSKHLKKLHKQLTASELEHYLKMCRKQPDQCLLGASASERKIVKQVLRLAICGGKAGPPLEDIIELLGNDECQKRIDNALQSIRISVKERMVIEHSV